MYREFVETSVFTKRLREFGKTELLNEIQNEILKDPMVGSVIRGTGGIRKMRCGSEVKGKRGGCRVLYADFQVVQKTYLLVIYRKTDRENISEDEKKILSILVEKIRKELRA